MKTFDLSRLVLIDFIPKKLSNQFIVQEEEKFFGIVITPKSVIDKHLPFAHKFDWFNKNVLDLIVEDNKVFEKPYIIFTLLNNKFIKEEYIY